MRDFITAAIALWPVIAFCAFLVAIALFALWVLASEQRTRRIQAARRRENELTLAYLRDVERVQRMARAAIARAKREESPANQREAAPWFGESA